MGNLALYGFDKVHRELHQRATYLNCLPSEGEKVARLMAWRAFIEDHIKLDDGNALTERLAQVKFAEASTVFSQQGLTLDITDKQFSDFFFNELGVLNRKVTMKSVQVVFYVFMALALFGLYALFT
jgi:hypothetical protein